MLTANGGGRADGGVNEPEEGLEEWPKAPAGVRRREAILDARVTWGGPALDRGCARPVAGRASPEGIHRDRGRFDVV